MQNNDLGSHWSLKFVILDIPTLFIPPADTSRFHFGKRGFGSREAKAAEYELNQDMVAWIVNVGRTRNIPCEIWSFLDDEDLMEELAVRLDRVAGDVLVGWQRWEYIEDAVLELKVDRTIHTVYDADPDRVAALWGMRGQRVQRGSIPSS